MKKGLFVLLAVTVVLSMVSIPALAGPPAAADGVWCYVPESMAVEKVVGGNQFLTSTDTGFWTGTFDGESDDSCFSVIHSAGHWWGRCTVSFASVTVDGRQGGLEMSVLVSQPYAGAGWDGKWVITGGTGDLKDLRGQGRMWGPGYNPETPLKCGAIDYWGNYHFKPD